MALARIPAFGPQTPVDLAAFEASIAGEVITPEDDTYEAARPVHSLNFDARPAIIVRAANATDVARTVLFARESGLELAVRSGGHSLAGYGTVEGGIVLDMGAMKGLYIDAERRLAWAQSGLTAGEFTTAAAEHGLATPFGDTGSVGIAGLTLGGGIGWLVRKYGLAIDSLVSVEVVTADGRIIVANETEHADLFWAIRGGGGNFGVVTRFQYRLHPVGQVLGGVLFMPFTRDVLRALGPIAASAPRELTTIDFVMALPPAPFVPPHLVGQMSLGIMFVYSGDPEDGHAAIAPFRQVATPMAEVVAPMPYPGIYKFLESAEAPGHASHRSVFLPAFEDSTVDAILEFHANAPSPMAMTQLRIMGGAMADVAPDATAFAHRDALAMITILGMYPDPADAAVNEDWVRRYYEALRPSATGVYVNFLEEEGEGRIREAYPTATYDRLADVKRRYDPSNLFHRNQNIQPAGAQA